MTETAQTTDAPPPARSNEGKVPQTLFVLDTTAIPGKGDREHIMIVNGLEMPFVFKPGIPRELPIETAIKFLKHDAFKRTDKDGNPLPYHRRPKQPDELEAGEKFHIGDNETIAKYFELGNMALMQRTLELPGGEAINKDNREAMIDFIKKSEMARRVANKAKSADIGRDDFVPEPEVEDAA